MKNRTCLLSIGWALFITATLLPACRSTTPPVQYYALSSLPEVQHQIHDADASQEIAIGLGPVELPEFLDRPQIVTRKGENELEMSEFHRWAGSLEGDFLRVLARNIFLLLPSSRVATYPWGDNFSPTYRIKLDVEQFDGQFGEQVFLEVTWSVTRENGTNELLVRHSQIREPISARNYDALVAAESQALAALSREIVNELHKLETRQESEK